MNALRENNNSNTCPLKVKKKAIAVNLNNETIREWWF